MPLYNKSFRERLLHGRNISSSAGGSTRILFVHLDGLCIELRLIDFIYLGLLQYITVLLPLIDWGVAFAQGAETLVQIVSEISLWRLLVSMVHQGFSIKAGGPVYLLYCRGHGSFGSLPFGQIEWVPWLLIGALPDTDFFAVIQLKLYRLDYQRRVSNRGALPLPQVWPACPSSIIAPLNLLLRAHLIISNRLGGVLHGRLWSVEVALSVQYFGHLIWVVVHFILSDPVLAIVDWVLGYITLVIETYLTQRDVLLPPAVTRSLPKCLMISRFLYSLFFLS